MMEDLSASALSSGRAREQPESTRRDRYKRLKFRGRTSMAAAESPSDSRTPYGVPIYDLMTSVKKRQHEMDQNDGSDKQSVEVGSHATQSKRQKTSVGHNHKLLSEKYRASDYFNLLGNEDANRHVLRWISHWRGVVYGREPTLSDYTDQLGRPLKKVLLINGPPGTGKTTAAHVIARQAGYDVLEINASDERSGAVVTDRIVSAIESHQVNSKRPICIVADEVEGASEHGFVRALVNILKRDGFALSNLGKTQTSKKGTKKKNSLLLRPIIAICNDVWAPSLRALRPHAEIIHFQRHNPTKLIRKLEEICKKERIPRNTRQLTDIAEANNFDLRACLNALQFGAKVILNDTNDSSSFEFTDSNSLTKRQFLGKRPLSFKELESCSDMDRLVTSCFTAYTGGSFIDDRVGKPAMIGELLSLSDSRFTHDELKAFVAHAFGYFFRSPRLAAQKSDALPAVGVKSFAIPPSLFDTTKLTKSVVHDVLSHSSLESRSSVSPTFALLEVMPMLAKIACPFSRAVLTPTDKARITKISQVLKSNGLSLRSERLENGLNVLRLDPPIELACIYHPSAQQEASSGSFIARRQIVEALEQLQRAPASSWGAPAPLMPTEDNGSAAQLTSISASKARKVDFFGNEITSSNTQLARAVDLKTRKVWVQYSEGFSNAVRKPIAWNELFSI